MGGHGTQHTTHFYKNNRLNSYTILVIPNKALRDHPCGSCTTNTVIEKSATPTIHADRNTASISQVLSPKRLGLKQSQVVPGQLHGTPPMSSQASSVAFPGKNEDPLCGGGRYAKQGLGEPSKHAHVPFSG